MRRIDAALTRIETAVRRRGEASEQVAADLCARNEELCAVIRSALTELDKLIGEGTATGR
jgi:hypothetical protein